MTHPNNMPKLSNFRHIIQKKYVEKEVSSQDIDNYEKFFFLAKKFPSLKAVPTKKIDTVWHIHIENEELYKTDCLKYFGYILEHKEFASDHDVEEQKKNFGLTNKMWKKLFKNHIGGIDQMAFCGLSGDDGTSDPSDPPSTDDSIDY